MIDLRFISPVLFKRSSEMRFLKFRANGDDKAVIFHSYPKLIFTWLLIVLGFTFYAIDMWGLAPGNTLGWTYAIVAVLTFVTMGIDIDRNHTIFWAVVIALCILSAMYLHDVKNVLIFGKVCSFVVSLNMTYNKDYGLFASIVLGIFFIVMLLHRKTDSKWRITHNVIEHISFGRADDSLGRGAKCIRTEYPDALEFIICLSGDLLVKSADGNTVLRRITNVPLLPFVKRKINKLIETTSVTTAEAESVAVVEDNEDHEGHGEHSETGESQESSGAEVSRS